MRIMDKKQLQDLIQVLTDVRDAIAKVPELTPHLASAIGAINAARDNLTGELNRRPEAPVPEGGAPGKK